MIEIEVIERNPSPLSEEVDHKDWVSAWCTHQQPIVSS